MIETSDLSRKSSAIFLTRPKPCNATYGLNSFNYCLNDFIRAIRRLELIG